MDDALLKDRVYAIVATIPKGYFMTYGQIAALCGSPRAARQVGQVAHYGPLNLPWHRVVNKKGGLARGWPGGGLAVHKAILEDDGVVVRDDFTVNLASKIWWPPQ